MTESLNNHFDAARRATLAYLTCLFTRRDLEAVSGMISEAFTGIGTGHGEFAPDYASAVALYQRDIEGIPSPIPFTLRKLDLRVAPDGAAVSVALLDLSAQIGAHRLDMKGLRMSLVWTGLPENPRILHMHLSLPTELHGDDEAYPLKEIHLLTEKLEDQISQRTKGLKEAYAELEQFVTRDELTGVLTRHKLNELLEQEFKRIAHYSMPLALLVVDLNDFKQINDQFGHLTGDAALKRFARALSGMIRETDYLGRWGGDEFLIVCPQSDQDEARAIAERIRDLDVTFKATEHEACVRIHASVGVAAYQPGDSIDSLFLRADQAMYRNKPGDRGRRHAADRRGGGK
ncbi:MAG: diguanylate cyclase [Halothiobacillaceae bacterium]